MRGSLQDRPGLLACTKTPFAAVANMHVITSRGSFCRPAHCLWETPLMRSHALDCLQEPKARDYMRSAPTGLLQVGQTARGIHHIGTCWRKPWQQQARFCKCTLHNLRRHRQGTIARGQSCIVFTDDIWCQERCCTTVEAAETCWI